MRLSEAIRLGAMLKPQAFGPFDRGDKSCALRAAGDAIGMAEDGFSAPFMELAELYPFLLSQREGCPSGDCSCRQWATLSLVWHLNDQHGWTREQIADWVATVEPSETPDAEATTDDGRGTTATEQPASVHARQGF